VLHEATPSDPESIAIIVMNQRATRQVLHQISAYRSCRSSSGRYAAERTLTRAMLDKA